MRIIDEPILATLVLMLASTLLAAPSPARAANPCTSKGQNVVEVMAKKKVAVYDAAGNVKNTIDKDRIVLHEPILECMNDPQLVRIKVTDARIGTTVAGESAPSVWVDRLEVKISGGNDMKAARPCKAAPPSAANDRKTPAVSGIDACSG